jgi:hypothetical protein
MIANHNDILSREVDRIAKTAVEWYYDLASQLDWEYGDYPDIRHDLNTLMEIAIETYGINISHLAADVYAEARATELGKDDFTPQIPPEALDVTLQAVEREELIRASIRHDVKGSRDGTFREQKEYLDRTLRNLAHATIAHNAANDPIAPRYKVTLSTKPCKYCQQTAREIEALKPGEKPGAWFHANCKCTVEPTWKKLPVRQKKPFTPTLEDLNVAMYGDPKEPRKGGHLHGYASLINSGKTELDSTWTPQRFISAIENTIRDPQWHKSVGLTNIMRREVDNVIFQVHTFEIDGVTKIVHAYPLNGQGVMEVFGGKLIPNPLDRTVLGYRHG